ncbi:MAG TPA: transcription antitermination factor NusB [Wenzhouxiangella sp.]|nr:transcription antitermination factor NusB [Wenzhouxiangella sp.]
MSRRRKPGPFEPKKRARRRALQALYQWQFNDSTATAIIEQFLIEQNFSGVDETFFKTLVREVVANHAALDEAFAPYLDRAESTLDQMERAILRLAACELAYHPETPYRVVIDEAVDLAHRFGAEQAHTFINSVVDRLAHKLRSVEIGLEADSRPK